MAGALNVGSARMQDLAARCTESLLTPRATHNYPCKDLAAGCPSGHYGAALTRPDNSSRFCHLLSYTGQRVEQLLLSNYYTVGSLHSST